MLFLIQILFEVHAQSYEELGDIFVHSAYTLSRNQVKYTQPADFDLCMVWKRLFGMFSFGEVY